MGAVVYLVSSFSGLNQPPSYLDRTIKGSIKKRQEAQQIYEKAKQEGRTAGLLEQERDNVFLLSL
jgi:hypothetical protein